MIGLIIVFLAAVSGCGPDQSQPVKVQGQLQLAGNGQLPDHANARISFIEHNLDNGDNRIVAERTLHKVGELPIHFSLSIDPKLLGGSGQYEIAAQVIDKHGRVKWETPAPHVVSLHEDHSPILLVLQPSHSIIGLPFHKYYCADGFTFGVSVDKNQAILRMGKRQIKLESQTNAPRNRTSPKVYSDTQGNNLSFTHSAATLRIDGVTHINCQPFNDSEPSGKKATE